MTFRTVAFAVIALSFAAGSGWADTGASGQVERITLERTANANRHAYELTAVVLNTSFSTPGAMDSCDGCPRGCTPLRVSVSVTSSEGKLIMYRWTEPQLCVAEKRKVTSGFAESERCFSEIKVVVSLEPSGGGRIAAQEKRSFKFPCEGSLIAPLTKLESLDIDGEPPTFFESTIERTTRPIGECFAALVADRRGLRGTIRVSMVVKTDRAISDVRALENDTGSKELGACVTDAIGKLRVARAPEADVTAVATFSFQSE